jgi:hypothetical protein
MGPAFPIAEVQLNDPTRVPIVRRRGGERSALSLPPSHGRDSVAGVAKTYPWTEVAGTQYKPDVQPAEVAR